jgi:hypothetical protein
MPDGAAGLTKDPELCRRGAHPGEVIAANRQGELPMVRALSFGVLDEGVEAFNMGPGLPRIAILIDIG